MDGLSQPKPLLSRNHVPYEVSEAPAADSRNTADENRVIDPSTQEDCSRQLARALKSAMSALK